MVEKSNMPVKLHLETQIIQDGQTESHVFDETGQLVKLGKTLYLRYTETTDQQSVPVRFKIEPAGDIQLTRGSNQAETQLRLYFKKSEKMASIYQTQYGRLPVVTTTNDLVLTLKDNPLSGELNIQYQLEISQQIVGDYNLRLIFTA